ncbi:MAG: hypothetical protein KKI06_08465 [Euryarchaeota archaeon]|nr:hypothetical protein [Euryarchaeota archaeon]
MSKNAATALSYLQNKNAAKSIDLERVARLRQLENQHIKAVEETQAKIERLKELGN